MRLLVDTSMWSLALRRDRARDFPEVDELTRALRDGDPVVVDALIAQLAIRHDHTLLTSDRDFVHAASHIALRVWPA